MDKRNILKDSFLDFMHALYDLTILNWLWLLCSLPIVTIGPATAAVYAVTLKMARDEESGIVKPFFKAFREGFPQALILSLLVGVLLVVAAGDAWFAQGQEGMLHTLYIALAVVLAVIALTLTVFGFPLQAMYRNSLKKHIGNAFALAFIAPAKTIVLWVLILLPVLMAVLLPRVAVAQLGFLYILFGFSTPMYLCSRILRTVFDKANGKQPPETEETKQ